VADWSPDGSELAVIRLVNGKSRVEYPIGHVLYETALFLSLLRVSPDGTRVAFVEYEAQERGVVTVVDTKGARRALSQPYYRPRGLAWRPDGKEVWFTPMGGEGATSVLAVTLAGQERVVQRFPGWTNLQDISRQGRVVSGG
jgi:Tol biopolymer transport system component